MTNAQYGSIGQIGGDNRPRDTIYWREARDFCAARGTRLPTEREWEYAARGPDNLIYPRGNAFVHNNVVYEANSDGIAQDVGSRPGGDSWVGASDLSGNAWEWVSSIFRPYPYDPDDGREDTNDSADVERVLRGGAATFAANDVRSSYRVGNTTDGSSWIYGFRCIRSY